MMQKVKVTSGLFCGLIGRVIQIDDSWPAPYGIRYGKRTWWFYAEELELATAQDVITCGMIPKHQRLYMDRFIPIRDRRMCADGVYR
jgi:hypothetical protein